MSALRGVDPACFDLAEHFLAGCKNVRPEDARELAEAFQNAAEDYCSVVDDRPAPKPERAAAGIVRHMLQACPEVQQSGETR